MKPCKHTNVRAFTLVELLVVIAIIGILLSMMLPAMMSTHEAARRLKCSTNLTKIGLAVQDYVSAFEVFPAGTVDAAGPIQSRPVGQHHSWLIRLLPYLDKPAAFAQTDFQTSIYALENAAVRHVLVAAFVCPSETGLFDLPPSSYAGSQHHVESPIDKDNSGVLFLNSRIGYADLADGRAQTLLVGEKIHEQGDLGWTSGTRATLRNTGHPLTFSLDVAPGEKTDEEDPAKKDASFVGGFASWHPAQVNMLFADGTVLPTDKHIDLQVLQNLAHRANAAPLSWP